MKYVKYFIMAVAAAVMASSCTDTEPVEIASVPTECEVEVTATPTSVTFTLLPISGEKPNQDYYDIYINDFYVGHFDGLLTLNNKNTGSDVFVPGATLTYTICSSGFYVNGSYLKDIPILSGTVTLPTAEEFLEEFLDGKTCNMMQESTSSNATTLTVVLPSGISGRNAYLDYSTSDDFSNYETCSGKSNLDGSLTFKLSDLQPKTKYFARLHGAFLLRSEDNEMFPYEGELPLDPDCFTTKSEDDVLSEAACTMKTSYAVDTYARALIYLPKGWEFYKEYTNDPAKCQVIYSRDAEFADYETAADATLYSSSSGSGYYYACNFSGLEPNTTYYVALKGNFKCTEIDKAVLDYILHANESLVTGSANRIETIGGHQCVDLGLSVKWATENLSDGDEEYFQWPDGSNLKDIAGTEYDVATNLWGASWQMPSEAQFKELVQSCSIYTFNDTSLIFIGSNGNYIILSPQGYKYGVNYSVSSKDHFYYWTSTASSEYRNYGVCLAASEYTIRTDGTMMTSEPVARLMSIRPVTTK